MDLNSQNSLKPILTLENKSSLRILGLPEYRRAEAKLQQYLASLELQDSERYQIVEQVMSRALACGNADEFIHQALQEVNSWVATRAQSHRFLSMPPIQRRSMVPKEIAYISWRTIRRSVIAWLSGKRVQAQLSIGKIPGR